ncbi:NADP-dependent oxidoreductase [Paenibacillus allorhizosphaerae]|uniref:Quinone oxidoreductase 1 n=1 Tax=Paenibacillus allorhizosphaerae TaxID=2849866 RepID=A0ABM8VJ87_9BACL|nr:NADP-dependent oxidoreductase [Paenibacillus allorhizosphaerae]CAG7644846.1 Quinone oxidoreductase 1 [Paenibacillus allorhizosphaerae]
MKAVRYHKHGGPEVLQLEEIPRPAPSEMEVLVRVHAAGLNPGDWQIRSGYAGDRFPLPYIPGWDVSGVVEAIGPGVSAFRVGDEVYGMTANSGACAEYVAVPVTQLARKPAVLSHIQAAAVPMSCFTAWHALTKQGRLQAGETVIVNGASGGVGHFAVQLAKQAGARVIGIASGRNAPFVRELGADQVIDYTAAPREQPLWPADLALDTVGGTSGDLLLNLLRPGGRLVPVAFGQYDLEKAAARNVTVTAVQLLQIGSAALEDIARWFDRGDLQVALDMTVPLAATRQAHERSESRRARGKIVIVVKPDSV